MEENAKLIVQHQRSVNPKIHEVIKQEVIKLLDAGLIYPIFDSPWVSPVHCVPKKGGITVVKNEENELIPTRLVTGWRVCIDYRKLNDATRKDHFPLPFMDQMLERLADCQRLSYWMVGMTYENLDQGGFISSLQFLAIMKGILSLPSRMHTQVRDGYVFEFSSGGSSPEDLIFSGQH
ncbi:hypothetical protein Tco_0541133 [Tanacetum coccineum]